MVENLKLIKPEKIPQYGEGELTKIALEAISDCPKIKKEREIKILTDRFGLGKTPKTLDAIGKQYGLTRERIRQIVNNAIRKIKSQLNNKKAEKILREMEKIAQKRGGILSLEYLTNHYGLFQKKDINALVFLAHLSKKLYTVKESKNLKLFWALGKDKDHKIIKCINQVIKSLEDQKNALSTQRIAEIIKQDQKFTRSMLEVIKIVMKDYSGKWGLSDWPQVNPKSIKDKAKYVLKKHSQPMHYSQIANKISQMGRKEVTKQSVHNELIKNKDFVLIGRGIYALLEWGYVPGVVEEVIASVLYEAGEPLHKNEIVKRVREKRIVKESTIILNLQKERFRRVAKAVYTLK